jgi:tRNA pseudouridine13 synthase
MTTPLPRAWGAPVGSALIRCIPEDFRVSEILGFELSGEGEHVFLYLQKRQLNSAQLLQRLSEVAQVAQRDIGMSGLKDRNAVTQQWFSVGLAGRPEPDWRALEREGDVSVLKVGRHVRKLKRGVHRANRFTLVLREVKGELAAVERRLQKIRDQGVPNYFGEQRFGRNGSTLEQARRWMAGARRISRTQRSLYFSALRSHVFNRLLAERVQAGSWNTVIPQDICMLHGTRSFFSCAAVTDEIQARAAGKDIHPGLPMWGRGTAEFVSWRDGVPAEVLDQCRDVCDFLEKSGPDLAWRPARMMPDDFSWQFCDDGRLQLDFALGAGSYATALVAEFVQYKEGRNESGIGSERG